VILKKIICKILRKTIKDQMKEFQLFINQIWSILDKLQYYNFIAFYENKKLVNDLKNLIIDGYDRQCDFILEINNNKEYQETYGKYDNIKIPYVWESFTEQNKNIIVMEYFESYKTLKDLTIEEKTIFKKIFVEHVISSFTFEYVMHSDLHQGNVIFMKEDDNLKMGIIDFGFITKFHSLEDKNQCYSIFGCLIENIDYEKGQYIIYSILKFLDQDQKEFGISDSQLSELKEYYENNKPTYLENFIELQNFFLHALKKGIKIPVFVSNVFLIVPAMLAVGQKLSTDEYNKNSVLVELRNKITEFYNNY